MLYNRLYLLTTTPGHNSFSALALYFLFVVLLAACSKDDNLPIPEDASAPITFASIHQEEEAVTRAATPLATDFTVYGYKTVNSQSQVVFNGYAIKYTEGSANTSVSNTHSYEYVGVNDNQDIKYWDMAASEYNFWGATGDTFNADGTTLTIPDLTLTTTEPTSLPMFSALYHRKPVTRDVVQLQFKRPYAQVRVMFYCGETLEDGDQVEIGASTFGPQSGSIISQGTLTVSYPKKDDIQETYTTSSTTTGGALEFEAVQLTHTYGTSSNNAALAVPNGGTAYYYVVPYSYAVPFVLTTTAADDPKTATVPAELMHWLPNYTYTYLFKITEAGKKIEFYDVKIDPWHYGGSQEEEWENW